MNNLLNKPLKAFVLCAILVLLCSIPVYYFIVDSIWLSEIDEHNQHLSEATKQNLQSLKLSDEKLEESVLLWDKLQPESKLQRAESIQPDHVYNIYRKNRYTPKAGYDRFHGRVSYFLLNGKPYSLTVETSLEESYETILAITAVTALFSLILIICLILLNRKISKNLWAPFYQTLQKIKYFDLNNRKNLSFEKTEVSEFEEMNKSIYKLIEGNISAYTQQKEFIENASHELQTPLALVQSKLDLMLQSRSLSPEISAHINDANAALSRVSRTNKNLLMLARIENQQFQQKEKFVLATQLADILELLADFIESKQITVQKEIHSLIEIEGDIVLIDILLTNLILNAIRHNTKNGQVVVHLQENKLHISNTGSTALQKEKLFKRFSSASVQTPGSGLGLAIVAEIALRYHWDVSYDFKDHMHHFTVSF